MARETAISVVCAIESTIAAPRWMGAICASRAARRSGTCWLVQTAAGIEHGRGKQAGCFFEGALRPKVPAAIARQIVKIEIPEFQQARMSESDRGGIQRNVRRMPGGRGTGGRHASRVTQMVAGFIVGRDERAGARDEREENQFATGDAKAAWLRAPGASSGWRSQGRFPTSAPLRGQLLPRYQGCQVKIDWQPCSCSLSYAFAIT
jgi:hypothetical protein